MKVCFFNFGPKVKEANFHGKEAHLMHREEEPSAILCTMTLDEIDASGNGTRYPVGISPIIDPDTGEVPIDSKGRRPSAFTIYGHFTCIWINYW